MAQEEEVLGKAYDSRLMKRLLQYLRPYKWPVGISLVSILIKAVADVLGPYLVAIEIDRYLVPVPRSTPFDSFLSANPYVGIAQIAAMYVGLIALGFLLDYLQTYFMQWAGQMVMFDLRKQIFRHLQHMHIGFYDKNPVGRLVTRVTSDVDALNEMFTSGVVSIFEDVFVLAGITAIMLGHELEAGADHAGGAAADRLRHQDFSRQGARFLPAHSHRYCAHQRLHAGARQRHGGVTAFQPRAALLRQVFGSERRPHGSFQGRDHGARGLLPGGGNSVLDRHRLRDLVWRE